MIGRGAGMTTRHYEVPPQLEDLLLEFTVNVLVNQPDNLVAYAVEYFTRLNESGNKYSGANSKLAPADTNNVQDGGVSDQDDSMMSEDEGPPQNCNYRRKSVFAEAYNPEEDDDEGQKAVFPKSDEQRARLSDAVQGILLFRALDPHQMQEVIDAMFERKVTAGENVIQQGDDGDNFYVIESGRYSIYVKMDDSAEPKKVGSYDNKGSFGELALMYNMPRAATITADEEGSLWAMDRQTFRRIVLKNAFKKRKMYESLLETVPMLKALETPVTVDRRLQTPAAAVDRRLQTPAAAVDRRLQTPVTVDRRLQTPAAVDRRLQIPAAVDRRLQTPAAVDRRLQTPAAAVDRRLQTPAAASVARSASCSGRGGALVPYERMNLADALVPRTFTDGELIIEQGDEADGMYFVEEGTVRITRTEHGQAEVQINVIEKGGYLGELALITKNPRAASAYAVGDVRLAFLDREAFERLLGPCMDVMKREMENYEEELQKIFGSSVNISDVR
ncbi:cAMP-dependent protein kinase type II regulatory subunit [Amphibalanus amphitrite]|uniref:cAMP-dependent protein kinase type II regulatory subunit n=1 Tax=Amphibalanus amphitrite TaxID=1232801 RepID=A0A6A4WE64_AMPAM|nr:cAMP-dependent protein kinase type II regulatory subunit [Amphibalanus amphitrite]